MPDRGGSVAKPLAPGWYPAANGKRANKLYWDGEEWHTAPPPAPPARRKKRRIWPWVLGIVLVLFLIGRCSDSGHQSAQTSPPASPSQSASPTSKEPFPTEYTPGNGTYEMGGIDGKDWGVWQADGAPSGVCEWSIRSVARYRGADILDTGQAGPGEKARVNIQADGDVESGSGEIGDHRLVFMTHNCGAWRFVS